MPTRYDKSKWLSEFVSLISFKGFCSEYARFLPFVAEFSKTFSSTNDEQLDVDLLKYLTMFCTTEELNIVE